MTRPCDGRRVTPCEERVTIARPRRTGAVPRLRQRGALGDGGGGGGGGGGGSDGRGNIAARLAGHRLGAEQSTRTRGLPLWRQELIVGVCPSATPPTIVGSI